MRNQEKYQIKNFLIQKISLIEINDIFRNFDYKIFRKKTQ